MDQTPFERFISWMANHERHSRETLRWPPPFAITLASVTGDEAAQLAEDLADYLNEFDELSTGGWVAYDREALRQILQHGGLMHLPDWLQGPVRTFSNEALTGERRLLLGLVQLGSVVIAESEAYRATQPMARVFHAGLTRSDAIFPDAETKFFHLVLNASRFSPASLVNIIGDSALEWATRGPALDHLSAAAL